MAKGKNRLEPYEKMLSKLIALTGGLIVLSAAVSGFDIKGYVEDLLAGGEEAPGQQEILEQVPEAGSSLYAEVNGGELFFTRAEIAGAREAEQPYESYSDLDKLGRCGTAEALLDKSLMPTEERGSIGMIRPSGWHTYRYGGQIPLQPLPPHRLSADRSERQRKEPDYRNPADERGRHGAF